METKQALGSYIREKRQALGLSQRELAEQLFVSESAVSKWERGVSYPDITLVSPLCGALGVSEHELITASDDERQRRVEKEAVTYRKSRIAWLICWSAIYAAAILSALAQAIVSGAFGGFFLAVASCAFLASFTHVPLLCRRERGAATLAASFVSLVLVMLASFSQHGAGWLSDVGLGVAALLFCYCLAFLPALLPWAERHLRLPATKHRALICLAADSVLLLALVAIACMHDGKNAFEAARMAGVAAVLISVVWAAFLSMRHIPAALPFRLAAAFASFGVWTFFSGGVLGVLMGGPFDLHGAADFTNWADSQTINDNLCWIILSACLAAATALCIAGTLRNGVQDSAGH